MLSEHRMDEGSQKSNEKSYISKFDTSRGSNNGSRLSKSELRGSKKDKIHKTNFFLQQIDEKTAKRKKTAKYHSPPVLSTSIDNNSQRGNNSQRNYFHSKKNSPALIYNELDLYQKKSTNPRKQIPKKLQNQQSLRSLMHDTNMFQEPKHQQQDHQHSINFSNNHISITDD